MEEWCGRCGGFFPEEEFDELAGVVYHRTPEGDRHPAEDPADQSLAERSAG